MMSGFNLKRIGMIMEPQAGDPNEVEGVLNPAAVRGKDGQLYLFPRLVAHGNYSRIGIARVLFDSAGDPTGVVRLGMALEPEADYELNEKGGGCEDPRISFVEPLKQYVMTYTAFSRQGPRIAIAVSDDLFQWRRIGVATFSPYRGMSFDGVDDKDASMFPVLIPGVFGQPAIGLVHRPLFPGTRPEEMARKPHVRIMDDHRECIWISYTSSAAADEEHRLCEFVSHHRLTCPSAPWEILKIGGGAPPTLCRHGWLLLYHGVHAVPQTVPAKHELSYSAGVMVLSAGHPSKILYRSLEPVLAPVDPHETQGTVPSVVFPTGVDRRDDLGTPDRFDVYYGMADNRIGVARLDVPETLPPSI